MATISLWLGLGSEIGIYNRQSDVINILKFWGEDIGAFAKENGDAWFYLFFLVLVFIAIVYLGPDFPPKAGASS